jgi:hypothetical protein
LISYSSFIIFSKMGYLASNIYCSFWQMHFFHICCYCRRERQLKNVFWLLI